MIVPSYIVVGYFGYFSNGLVSDMVLVVTVVGSMVLWFSLFDL